MPRLENKIPPLIIAVIFGAAMWGISTYVPGVRVNKSLRTIAAAAVVVMGAFFCIAGVISFGRAKTTVSPLKPETASVLVSSGIYHISRNPMYVGFALLLVAWAIYLSSPAALSGVVGFTFYINRFQIEPEEQALTNLFGEKFAYYKLAVRKWL